jgi:hypothetical protein
VDKFLKAVVSIAIICAVMVGIGIIYVGYKAVEAAGGAASEIDKVGLKGVAVRLWCGKEGCK